MSRRTFTPAEVQALIPTLELIFGRLVALAAEARPVNVAQEGAPDEARLKALAAARATELSALVQRVRALGGEIKDFQRGLVDFPGVVNGQEVCLCWQFGERRLAWWHTEAEGFAGRKPLEQAPEVEVEGELLN